MNNPFWDYSIAHYAIDGVAPACVALQDEFGLDVNVVLYAAWWGARGMRLEQRHLNAIETAVAPWRNHVVVPLRKLRRQWRDYPGEGEFRDAVKALELQAERRQQDMMYELGLDAGVHRNSSPAVAPNLLLLASQGGAKRAGLEAAVHSLAALLQA